MSLLSACLSNQRCSCQWSVLCQPHDTYLRGDFSSRPTVYWALNHHVPPRVGKSKTPLSCTKTQTHCLYIAEALRCSPGDCVLIFSRSRPHAVVADRGPGAKKGEKGKSMSYVAARAVFSPTDSTSPLSVSPSETALLLIDYQNIAVARLGDAAPSVLGIARQMRDWALCKGMSVYHCLIDTRPGITQPPARNKIAAKWRMYEDKFAAVPGLGFEADVLAPVDPGWEKTVLRTPGLISALESRGLMDELVSRGVKSLMVCGIVTSGCVLSTARAATDQGFIVTVVEDACFDPVPGLHGMLCAHALPMTAHVATAGEIRDAWKVL